MLLSESGCLEGGSAQDIVNGGYCLLLVIDKGCNIMGEL